MSDTVVVEEQVQMDGTPSPNTGTNTEEESGIGIGNGKSPFACNVCQRSYRRVDHLARHYRSHTREKPFVCNTCGKGFSRTDLLKRHSIGHTERKDLKRFPTSAPQVARVSQACTACANSKLKCGNQKPCQRCRQRGITCTFTPQNDKPKKSQPKKAQAETLDLDGMNNHDVHMGESEGNGHVAYHNQQEVHRHDEISPLDSMPAPSMMGLTEGSNTIPSSGGGILDFDDSSLAEFLRDVMMPPTPNALSDPNAAKFLPPTYYGGRDVFNFGMDSSLDLTDLDFNWIDSQQYRQLPVWNSTPVINNNDMRNSTHPEPVFDTGATAGAEAYQKSVWRWKPDRQDHASAEQAHFSIPHKDMQHLGDRLPSDVLGHRIEQTSRDKILAMVLRTCGDQPDVSQVVSSFPSADFLDSLMHSYFRSEMSREDSWVHIPTFRPQTNRAEWNAIIVAAGAVLSSIPTVRKLGFAIQEAVRMTVPVVCEKDNSKTRELQLVQTFALQLAVGLWSGNKRKMEIAECHAQPLITMLRRAGHYRRRPATQPPLPTDDEHTLDVKWRAWVEAESFKRLAFHTVLHDAQASIALLTRPNISYAEISLELPYSLSLWRAKSACEWRDVYLHLTPSIATRLPSLMQSMNDLPSLVSLAPCLDIRFSITALLHAMWSLVSEYRQYQTLKTYTTTTTLLSPHNPSYDALNTQAWHQELTNILSSVSMTFPPPDLSHESTILQELFLMNLHVSMEELQLFAGKEGTEEAVRVYPFLRTWWKGRKARQAIWHAGQVLRAAEASIGELRDFYAVSVYHAALCFWVWGMCELGNRAGTGGTGGMGDDVVWLDGEGDSNSRRFIAMAGGTPMIRGFGSERGGQRVGCRLNDPKGVMEVVIAVMGRSCAVGTIGNGGGNGHGKGRANVLPALVENLSQLMRDLGGAARSLVKRGGSVYS